MTYLNLFVPTYNFIITATRFVRAVSRDIVFALCHHGDRKLDLTTPAFLFKDGMQS